MRVVSRLDRHIVGEVALPSVLAFLIYTVLVLMQALVGLMEQVVVHGVSPADALVMLWIGVPSVVVLTIPMSYLFGVLLAVGKLNADNELIALEASGVSARRLLRPILALGVLLALGSGYLYVVVMPSSNRDLTQIKRQFFTSGAALGRIEARVFYDEFPNILLYVDEVDPETNQWRDILIHRSVNPDEEELTLARRGRIVEAGDAISAADPSTTGTQAREPWIVLDDMVTYTIDRNEPENTASSTVLTHAFKPLAEDSGRATTRYRLALRERDTLDLLHFMRTGRYLDGDDSDSTAFDTETEQRLAGIEFHRRFAIPMACVTFALLALPLGIGARAGGRGRGFLLSIVVVLAYYVLNTYGEILVIEKGLPAWLGIWMPNALVVILALTLYRLHGRWLGERQAPENLLARAVRRLRDLRSDRRARMRDLRGDPEQELTGSIPVSVQRRRYSSWAFPSILDRYAFRRILTPLALMLVSTLALFLIADLTDRIDDIIEHEVPGHVMASYYWSIIPQTLVDAIPIALLISVLTMLTIMGRQRELTALKAAGVSVFRLLVPLILMALLGVAGMWFLSERVVPEANREAWRMLERIKGHHTPRTIATNRTWLLSRDGSTYYNFLNYDVNNATFIRFTAIEVDDQMRLRSITAAPRVRWMDGGWIADAGWIRRFDVSGVEDFRRLTRPTEFAITESPAYFGQEHRKPSEMNRAELGVYIRELEESGYQVSKLKVRWHQKLVAPLAALVLVVMAIPLALASEGRRRSTMQGVAIAVGLGLSYLVLVGLFGKLGEADLLPPALSAWAPVGLGLLFAANRLTTVKT